MHGIKSLLFFSLLCFWCDNLPAREESSAVPGVQMMENIQDHDDKVRPHKVFLHLDKNCYVAGENIWFKTYLVDAVRHQPLNDSINLYVELVNARGEIVDARLFLVTEGFAWGDFALPENIEDGNYFIRAYSQWMKNTLDELHFSKFFYIRNPDYAHIIPRSTLRFNKRFNRDLEKKKGEVHMAFFPEGGNFIAGIENRLAFRITDGLGNGLDMEGEILNRKGDFVTHFITSHAGLGSLLMTPQPGETYHAKLKTHNARRKKYPAPAAALRGFVLRLTESGDSLHLRVQSNLQPGDPLYSESLILLFHTGGNIHFDNSFVHGQGIFNLSVSRRLFPSGINHLTVSLPDERPVLDRRVFVNRNDQLIMSANMMGESTEEGKSELLLNVIHPDKGPVEGTFSVSVQVPGDWPGTYAGHILSDLLLSSQLPGIAEEPANYFASADDVTCELDLLMLSQEWRGFTWNKLQSDVRQGADHTDMHGIIIRGMVIDPANNKPVPDHSVQLRILSGYNHLFSTKTNSEGIFTFPGFYYNDRVDIELMANRLQSGTLPFISMMAEDETRYEYVKNMFTEPQSIVKTGRDWKRPPRRVSGGNGSKTPGAPPSMYGTPDQTIYVDERVANYRSVFDILVERGSGISFNQGQLRIRGSTSYFGSNEPLLFVDGTQMDIRSFAQINPRDVHRIEIFKGANSAIFGARGANGAIIAYTKRYANISHKEYYDFTILGFHTPREFYNDRFPVMLTRTRYLNPLQTLLWEPDFRTDQHGKGILLIPATKEVGSMRIIIQGIGMDGTIGYEEFLIRERDK